MSKAIRLISFAAALLLAFISLPLWLPGLQAAGQEPAQKSTPEAKEALSGTEEQAAAAAVLAQLSELEAEPVTLLDAGWVSGSYNQTSVLKTPAVWQWLPGEAAVGWRLETGLVNGAYLDESSGLIYLVERRDPEIESLEEAELSSDLYTASGAWPSFLTVLDAESGRMLSRTELADIPVRGAAALYLFPVARQGQTLYLRNYESFGLLSYDLESGTFGSERWKLCDEGYAFDSYYLAAEGALVTFCSSHSSESHANLSKVSLDDGSIRSVEVPQLGREDYMSGNGFAMTQHGIAYVVDSDGGSLAEVNLESMQVLRQVEYRPADEASTWLQQAGDWLLRLAASPARAKRWMSSPAISPDGRHLAVDGGFGIGNGTATSLWLIDLRSLETVGEIELPGSPQALHFASEDLLYILMQNELPLSQSELLVFELSSQSSLTVDLPPSGRLTEFIP